MYGSDIEKVLVTREQIAARVTEIAAQINADYKGEELLFVCTLRGASIFFADLFRQIEDTNTEADFIAVSSYGKGTTTSGEVKLVKDLSSPVVGKHIIIVEDIVDTGITLTYLKKLFAAREPASVKICTLLDKPSRRKVELTPEYVGFQIPNEFVIGYGLDYNEKYRNLPDVCVLSPSVYAK